MARGYEMRDFFRFMTHGIHLFLCGAAYDGLGDTRLLDGFIIQVIISCVKRVRL